MIRPLVLSLIPLAALIVASLTIGAARMEVGAHGDLPWAILVMMESRLPRTLAVVLTGAALSVAGIVMQQLVRNKFVGPDTTGTSESAALGLLAITIWYPASPVWLKMMVASSTSLIGTALFLAIVRRLPPHEVMLVPVAGIILSGVTGGMVTFVAWEYDLVQYVEAWLSVGEFSGVIAGRYEMLWLAGAASFIAWFTADRFSILGLGESVSVGLGLDPKPVVRFGLAVVALVSAMVVVTVGMIPFVGLVVPNIVSRMLGDHLRQAIPVVATVGATLVLACDVLGRVLIYPYEIPVGTVMGVSGSLIFLFILYKPRVGI